MSESMGRADKLSAAKVKTYKVTSPLLTAMYRELQQLSKKTPEATLNKTKVIIINRLLVDVQEVLVDEPDVKYLDLLDDDALPQYSDVVLILSQYETALEEFRRRFRDWI